MSEDPGKRLLALGITRVALFDDETPNAGSAPSPIDDDAWQGLINGLASEASTPLDPDRAEDLRSIDADEREAALDELQSIYPEPIALLRSIPGAIRDAGVWVDWLTANGAKVDAFQSWSKFEDAARQSGKAVDAALGEYGLILLDYDFGTADKGKASERIAMSISEQTRLLAAAGASVPILARFQLYQSSEPKLKSWSSWEGSAFPEARTPYFQRRPCARRAGRSPSFESSKRRTQVAVSSP